MKLAKNEQVVQVVEFETADPALRGEMTITYALADADGGTDVFAVHDRLPPGLSTSDNETGWRISLAKLAALVEAGQNTRDLDIRQASPVPALTENQRIDSLGHFSYGDEGDLLQRRRINGRNRSDP